MTTIGFVEQYCQLYRDLFPEVRSFEAFKLLHLGMVSEIKRKSLPAIARAVGLDTPQNLHHFLSESPWSVDQARQRRLEIILQILDSRSLTLLSRSAINLFQLAQAVAQGVSRPSADSRL